MRIVLTNIQNYSFNLYVCYAKENKPVIYFYHKQHRCKQIDITPAIFNNTIRKWHNDIILQAMKGIDMPKRKQSQTTKPTPVIDLCTKLFSSFYPLIPMFRPNDSSLIPAFLYFDSRSPFFQ